MKNTISINISVKDGTTLLYAVEESQVLDFLLNIMNCNGKISPRVLFKDIKHIDIPDKQMLISPGNNCNIEDLKRFVELFIKEEDITCVN